ncbi:hypothetical protein [Amycolatopsis sp. NPDC059021]|uniref:hypothetical protein n=1 Tax=Amycolatopsis sp. NPDC059021 TaxID=3346704 RepID=UPI0036735EA2
MATARASRPLGIVEVVRNRLLGQEVGQFEAGHDADHEPRGEHAEFGDGEQDGFVLAAAFSEEAAFEQQVEGGVDGADVASALVVGQGADPPVFGVSGGGPGRPRREGGRGRVSAMREWTA